MAGPANRIDVLDDFAMAPLTERARRDLLEDRYGLRATLITGQLKHERWRRCASSSLRVPPTLERLGAARRIAITRDLRRA